MARTITVGGAEREVAALTLDQLREVMPAFAALRQPASAEGMAAARVIVAAALGIPVEEAGRLRTTLPEILAAIAVVAEVSGLRQLGEAGAAGSA